MLYLCDLFFIFIIINDIISLKQMHLLLQYALLVLDDNVMRKANNFQIAKAQPQGTA